MLREPSSLFNQPVRDLLRFLRAEQPSTAIHSPDLGQFWPERREGSPGRARDADRKLVDPGRAVEAASEDRRSGHVLEIGPEECLVDSDRDHGLGRSIGGSPQRVARVWAVDGRKLIRGSVVLERSRVAEVVGQNDRVFALFRVEISVDLVDLRDERLPVGAISEKVWNPVLPDLRTEAASW